MSSRPKLKYFGTSGIRGRTLIDITPSLAEKMARAYAKVVVSGIPQPHVVIARDTRFGAETIESAIIAGLTAAGVSVSRCGTVPTPTLCTYGKYVKADGMIMITGSHIPPDRIGIIFMEDDGAYVSDYIAFQIEQQFDSFDDNEGLIKPNGVEELKNIGWIKIVPNIWEVYEDVLESLLDLPFLRSKSLRLIVDSANGTASGWFTKYLGDLGMDVTSINDYHSPLSQRLSEPIDDNLERLKFLVANSADLGIAFDIDADRVTFVTPIKDGVKTVPAQIMGALILYDLLETGYTGDIVVPINTSNLIEDLLNDFKEFPGKIHYCRVGQPGTIERVKKIPNPLFSFEESAKFYFLKNGLLWTDGPLMALRVIELMLRKEKSLADLIKPLEGRYITLTRRIQIDDETMDKFRPVMMRKLKEITFKGEKSRIDIDGLRVNFDQSWLLMRPSGTEPKIRIVVDARSKERATELLEIGDTEIHKILDSIKN